MLFPLYSGGSLADLAQRLAAEGRQLPASDVIHIFIQVTCLPHLPQSTPPFSCCPAQVNHKFADRVAVKSGDATAATSPRRPRLLLSIAALVPLQVARALQAMHSLQPQPLIHRDVKPHNVLLRLRSADGGNSRRRGRCAVLGAQPV